MYIHSNKRESERSITGMRGGKGKGLGGRNRKDFRA
jgi:hypothetical protein